MWFGDSPQHNLNTTDIVCWLIQVYKYVTTINVNQNDKVYKDDYIDDSDERKNSFYYGILLKVSLRENNT